MYENNIYASESNSAVSSLSKDSRSLSSGVESLNDEASGPSLHGRQVFDDLGAVVGVLDSLSSEAVSPGDALNAVDEENVRSVQKEVVDESGGVGNFRGDDLTGLDPGTVDSDGMTLGDGQATREGEQALGSRAGNLDHAADSGKAVSNGNLVTLTHIFDTGLSSLGTNFDS